MQTNLLDQGNRVFKPFRYPWAYELWQQQHQMHWLPEEVTMSSDIDDWERNLTAEEKNLLTNIFRFFTQGDIEVQDCYHKHYMQIFKPVEIQMMLGAFSDFESIHVAAYSHLLETVGMPEIEYSSFMKYKEMGDKIAYLHSANPTDKREIARTMALFSAFTEGVQLFSSFAILLNFPRFNKMKGMGQIITWSVRDECYSDDTEILTSKGWKLFKDLDGKEEVAQFDKDTREVSFVVPKRVVSYKVNKDLVHYSHNSIDFLVTENHRKLIYRDDVPSVIEAKDIAPHYRIKLPISGYKTSGARKKLTPLERIYIAMQADGTIPKGEYRNGNICGYRRCMIRIKKERKVERLRLLLKQAKLDYHEKPYGKTGKITFHIDLPVDISKKFSDWVDLSEITSEWAEEFLMELVHWDGSVRDNGLYYYSTTDADNMDMVQALIALCGWHGRRAIQVDNRKESYKDIHRINYCKKHEMPMSVSSPIQKVAYKGKVWCVEVDTGFLVVRRNGKVCVSGNTLHVKGIMKLFHTFIEENPEIWDQAMVDRIVETAQQVIKLEDNFIDLCFEMGGVKGLHPSEVKTYIRYVLDFRICQLNDGISGDLKIPEQFGFYLDGAGKHPLPWLEEQLNAVEHSNFFERRSTEYTKSGSNGSWHGVWQALDQTA
jgi:ribonucleotide reductase beta subunit family protein with ferritin-like domain